METAHCSKRMGAARPINSVHKAQEAERTTDNHAARVQTGLGQRRKRAVGPCKALEAT